MEKLWFLIFESAWVLLPGYVANMAPIWFQRVPFLNTPVDFGKTFGGKPLFGPHKTYRGFFFGVLFAIITVYVQIELAKSFDWAQNISLLDYQILPSALIGFVLGFGALVGDLVKSFFKRRIGIPSGKSWFPFDQLDYVVGMIVLLLPFYRPDLAHVVVMVVSSLVFHVIVSYIGYLFKMKKDKI